MKTILVLTDFSEYALYALKVAASIAKKVNAKINDQAEEKLNTLVNMDILKEIEVSKLVVTNMLIRRLVTHNKYKDVDLIVIGSHGTSGHSDSFIGSNTEKVVRLANAQVLTIKNNFCL